MSDGFWERLHAHELAHLRGLRRPEGRTIRDPAGTWWLVYELPATEQPFPMRRCLVFESVATVRRVLSFSDTWRELDDAALLRLSRRR